MQPLFTVSCVSLHMEHMCLCALSFHTNSDTLSLFQIAFFFFHLAVYVGAYSPHWFDLPHTFPFRGKTAELTDSALADFLVAANICL